MKAIVALGAAFIVGCFIHGGIYTTTQAGQGVMVYVVNKFTGESSVCAPAGCRRLDPMPPIDAATGAAQAAADAYAAASAPQQ